MTEPAVTFVEIPPLPDLSHAILESVTIGPHRAVTLVLTPLLWVGTQGQRGQPVTVHLGGIVNLDEVTTFFAPHHIPTELAWLRYAAKHVSKPGDLYLEIVFERVEAQIVIHCHSVQMTE